LAQSRYVLLESMMILLSLLAMLGALKMKRAKPFSTRWLAWLATTVSCMGAAFSVKYLAIYSCWLVFVVVAREWWFRVADRRVTLKQLALEASTMVSAAIFIPLLIYIGSFYAHLALLTKAGSHDSLMTSAFQVITDYRLS